MQNGYIKLWRKGINSRAFKNDGLWKVWTWCLMKASHKKRWVSMRTGKSCIEIEIHPGQFVFGRNSAAKELGMKPSTVRNRIEKLKNMRNVDINKDRQYSIISIVNWDTYQPIEKKEDTKEDKQRTSKGQAKDTNKNVKNIEKEKFNDFVLKIISFLNDSVGTSFKHTTKGTIKVINARLKEGYTEEDFYTVIRNKKKSWHKDPDLSRYLRPITLFGNKFESYLNENRINGNQPKIEYIDVPGVKEGSTI